MVESKFNMCLALGSTALLSHSHIGHNLRSANDLRVLIGCAHGLYSYLSGDIHGMT